MRVFYLVGKILSYRYTLVVASHQKGRCRSLTISLGRALSLLAVWVAITGIGLLFFFEGSSLVGSSIEAGIYKTRVQFLAQEIRRMREVATELAVTLGDFSYLMTQDNSVVKADSQNASSLVKVDTLSQLLVGKVSENTLNKLQAERQVFQKRAHSLLACATSLLTQSYDWANKRAAVLSEWPAAGTLASGYGVRLSPFDREEVDMDYHRGLDIANIEGTPIRAPANGIVRRAGWMNGYGRTIILDHGFGLSTLYAHASTIAVSQGDYVQRGDLLAYMGSTGRSTGSHLHFETWEYGRPVNPFKIVHVGDFPTGGNALAQIPQIPEFIFPSGVGGARR